MLRMTDSRTDLTHAARRVGRHHRGADRSDSGEGDESPPALSDRDKTLVRRAESVTLNDPLWEAGSYGASNSPMATRSCL